ncbi:hypothetical protein [Psychrobacillus antarcticus]|uniref:hypothetical protein n=1 Tax=Psychrobacillus antarcticus TaxID=2879115 RepID=UPI0024081EFD|nr:hypothetical protein [Psychrobacillus antarcticus]
MNYSKVSTILSLLTNFKNDKNQQHLNQVFSHIEVLLQYFPQILVTKTPEDIEGVRSSVVTFRKSVGQHLSYLEKDINETRTSFNKNTEKLNELTTSIESQKSRIDSVVSDFQGQFLQAQTERTQEFNEYIKEIEKEYENLIESNHETFDELVSTQQETFDTLNEGFQHQADTQQTSFGTLIEEMKTEFHDELDRLREMNKEAEKILGLMSMKGLAQGYQKIANSEALKATSWNTFSILSLIGILCFGYKFIILHEGVMSWTALISRIVLTGVGITLFTYCAKQATNHRNEERRNRKIELELASLDPYIKDLEPDKQKLVKENLIDKYFGVELPNATAQQGQTQQQMLVDSVSNNPQLIQVLAEQIKQLMTPTPK